MQRIIRGTDGIHGRERVKEESSNMTDYFSFLSNFKIPLASQARSHHFTNIYKKTAIASISVNALHFIMNMNLHKRNFDALNLR